ncbi:hypothetical protein MRX96_011807 [Rhipicephalus microplus]
MPAAPKAADVVYDDSVFHEKRSLAQRLCDPTLKALVENKAAVNLTDQNRLHAVPVLYQGNVVFIVYQYYINHLQGCVLANQSSAEQYYT